MDWEAIGALGEVFGAVAVLVTLAFLANQIRQNNSLGKAEAERGWFSDWHSIIRECMGSEESVELFRNGLDHYSKLSPNDQAVFSTRVLAMFDHVDVLRRLHEKGYITDDLLNPVVNVLNAIAATPGGKDWWEEIGPMLSIATYFEKHRNHDATPMTKLMPYFNTIVDKGAT